MKKLFLVILVLFMTNISFSQISGRFSIAGGPFVGYYANSVSDLNAELAKAGFPQLSNSGFLTIGGGGYVDIPMVPGFRVGGYGFGFSESQTSNSITTAVNYQWSVKYSYSGGGITLEYAKFLGEKFDFTLGGALGMGNLKIDLYRHAPSYYWNSGTSLWDTTNSSKQLKYSSQTYTIEPRIGIGYQVNNFLNFKLNAGYAFAIQDTWKADDVLEVQNVPSGIKAQGLNVSLNMNVGLFLK